MVAFVLVKIAILVQILYPISYHDLLYTSPSLPMKKLPLHFYLFSQKSQRIFQYCFLGKMLSLLPYQLLFPNPRNHIYYQSDIQESLRLHVL